MNLWSFSYDSNFSRIYELLPPKIQQWQSSPCVTEENNKKMLEKIRREQLECRQKLAELDLKHQELDGTIERAKHVSIAPEQDVKNYIMVFLYKHCLSSFRLFTISAANKFRLRTGHIIKLYFLCIICQCEHIFPQEKDNEDDLELSLYCVTCGAELNQKGALRHMEKCFSKVCCMHYLTSMCWQS